MWPEKYYLNYLYQYEISVVKMLYSLWGLRGIYSLTSNAQISLRMVAQSRELVMRLSAVILCYLARRSVHRIAETEDSIHFSPSISIYSAVSAATMYLPVYIESEYPVQFPSNQSQSTATELTTKLPAKDFNVTWLHCLFLRPSTCHLIHDPMQSQAFHNVAFHSSS